MGFDIKTRQQTSRVEPDNRIQEIPRNTYTCCGLKLKQLKQPWNFYPDPVSKTHPWNNAAISFREACWPMTEMAWILHLRVRILNRYFWIEKSPDEYWKYPGWFTSIGGNGRHYSPAFGHIWPMHFWEIGTALEVFSWDIEWSCKLRIFHLNWRWGFVVGDVGLEPQRWMDLCETDLQIFKFISWIPICILMNLGETCAITVGPCVSFDIGPAHILGDGEKGNNQICFLHCLQRGNSLHQELVTIDRTNRDNLWTLHMYNHFMTPIWSFFQQFLLYPAMQTCEAILEKLQVYKATSSTKLHSSYTFSNSVELSTATLADQKHLLQPPSDVFNVSWRRSIQLGSSEMGRAFNVCGIELHDQTETTFSCRHANANPRLKTAPLKSMTLVTERTCAKTRYFE